MLPSPAFSTIHTALVQRLVRSQFPHWRDLPIRSVIDGGWDNRTFHLGERMTVRLPSAACYAEQVAKEQRWLPKLAPLLPLPIPTPLAMGRPGEGYPWPWSVYAWRDGETAAKAPVGEMTQFASDLAAFLAALQKAPTADAPPAGAQNFHRGRGLLRL